MSLETDEIEALREDAVRFRRIAEYYPDPVERQRLIERAEKADARADALVEALAPIADVVYTETPEKKVINPEPIDSEAAHIIEQLFGKSVADEAPVELGAADRVCQAVEKHRELWVGFTTAEIETSENCLMAAAIVLYRKSFTEVLAHETDEQLKEVIDLAVAFAKALPAKAVARVASGKSKASKTAGSSDHGYI